jgi:hypothetical protein
MVMDSGDYGVTTRTTEHLICALHETKVECTQPRGGVLISSMGRQAFATVLISKGVGACRDTVLDIDGRHSTMV